jgi:hypothetical protein
MSTEHGPVFGVELLDSLPIGHGNMRQAMPSCQDLVQANNRVCTRVSGGYEVLLDHWREAKETMQRAMRNIDEGNSTAARGNLWAYLERVI